MRNNRYVWINEARVDGRALFSLTSSSYTTKAKAAAHAKLLQHKVRSDGWVRQIASPEHNPTASLMAKTEIVPVKYMPWSEWVKVAKEMGYKG